MTAEKKRRGRASEDATVDAPETAEMQVKPAKGTTPGFRPASRLGYLKARPGFTARWVKNDPDNVARKKAEGWIIMKPDDNKGVNYEPGDVTDAKALHDGIRYRDMIAMMLPDDVKKARDEYYREETQSATRAILRQSDNEFQSKGVQTYTPKGMAGRIVIE